MFQSPLGGIAFIINILIVGLSSLINKLRGQHVHKPVLSQPHIDRLHSTKHGRMVSHTLAYIIPIFIFTAVSSLASHAYTFFYNDYKKITIIDVTEASIELSKHTYAYIDRVIKEGSNASTFTNINKPISPIDMYLGADVYNRTQLQALELQDKIAETVTQNFPAITNIFTKR